MQIYSLVQEISILGWSLNLQSKCQGGSSKKTIFVDSKWGPVRSNRVVSIIKI